MLECDKSAEALACRRKDGAAQHECVCLYTEPVRERRIGYFTLSCAGASPAQVRFNLELRSASVCVLRPREGDAEEMES